MEKEPPGMCRIMKVNKSGIGFGLLAAVFAVALVAGCGSGTSGQPSSTVPATNNQGVPNYASSSNWLSLPSA
jgi:ABC-type phosphate transport system substrate-binding protein